MGYAKVKTTIPGPKTKELLKQWHENEADKLGYQAQVAIDHGRGAMLYDVDDNVFIDWSSGVLVTNVGHCHPKLVEAVQEASEHVLNVYEWCTPYRANAARDLVNAAPSHLDKCFFMSSGSEVTDCSARIMKRYTHNYEIISFYGGFHGRTLSTASLGGLSKSKYGMGPMLPGSIRVPYPYCYRCPFKSNPEKCGLLCLEFMNDIIRANSTGSLAGLIIEPYQGSAGFIFPPEGFLPAVESWCREKNIPFTLDEVQSSYGRTGKMWALEHEALTPDIVTVGKGIGSGVTVAALLMRDEMIKDSMHKGDMGSTYGGNPISCAAVSAVLKIMKDEKLPERAARLGKIISSRLSKIQEKCKYIGDVRGRGMVWGVELVEDRETKEPAPEKVNKLIDLAAEKGLLIGSVGMFGNVVRVAPPLVITEEQLDESLEIFEQCTKQL